MHAIPGEGRRDRGSTGALRLCFLGVLLFACVSASPPKDATLRMEWQIERWFSALAESPRDHAAEGRQLSNSHIQFELADASVESREELTSWLVALRSPYSRVDYELHGMRAERVDDHSYRVRFEVGRNAIGEDGLPHVARSRQTWLIQERVDSKYVVVHVESAPLLAFPGTGPQIVCY